MEKRGEFLRLFLKHEPGIYGFVRSVVPNQSDAEDVFQEVAVVLWEKFDQYQPSTRFDSWALKIAHNQVLYYRQKSKRNKLSFDDALISQLADDQVQWADSNERREALQGCIEKLDSADRDLIARRFSGETSNRSVAAELQWSESSVSRALSRIYLTLMRCVGRAQSPF
jgi:RNA polymerase sigma-70 factor (ECF subfamily)